MLAKLSAALDRQLSPQSIWRTLPALQLSFKKTIHAAEQDRPDVAKRRLWHRLSQCGLPVEQLVILDESGASTKMTRLRGRAPRDQRLLAKVPHGPGR